MLICGQAAGDQQKPYSLPSATGHYEQPWRAEGIGRPHPREFLAAGCDAVRYVLRRSPLCTDLLHYHPRSRYLVPSHTRRLLVSSEDITPKGENADEDGDVHQQGNQLDTIMLREPA